MPLIKKLSARLQNHPKRVAFTAGEDPRVLSAARQFATKKLGAPILIGNKAEIEANAKQCDIRLDGMKIVSPVISDDFESLKKILAAIPKFKAYDSVQIAELASSPIYFACLMLLTGRVDAIVVGAKTSASGALRPILQTIPLQKGFTAASSMMVLSTGNPDIGLEGDIFMADCEVIAEPTAQQLCDIAITTASLVGHLTLKTPKVAMLGFTSKIPNAKLESIMKMKSATALAHAKAIQSGLDMEIDGELQVDAALRPEVAEAKGISSSVAGKANVLIFPDLDAGNIASKMLQSVSSTKIYGQILTGLSKPVAEVSRGASADDIFGAAVIVGAQAVDRRFISPLEG